jgi:hypothetical protein
MLSRVLCRSSLSTRRFSALTVQRFDREGVRTRLFNLHDAVVSANWADPVTLALDVPFWEAEADKVRNMVEPYLVDGEIGTKATDLNRAMDCLYACEDVRDFLNEVGEVGSRSTGVMGVGALSGPKVTNVDEIAEKVVENYEELKSRFPEFKAKIEQSVGHGLATLRTKHKFNYSQMHRYFF